MKRILRAALLLALILSSGMLTAQESSGGTPPSFSNDNLSTQIPLLKMPAFNVQAMKAEDELYYSQKGQMFRFGNEFDVNLNLENSGLWETLENGDRIWRLAIGSTDANSINLMYDHFELPNGASFFLYNSDGSEQLGAFTSFNNKEYKSFSTSFINDETCYLEYFEPAAVAGQGIISINTVVHGYRSFAGDKEKGFNDSGSCNNNVNCPEGVPWVNEINSVGLIVDGGFRLCTGAMVNNMRQDCTPYFVTADHCLGGFSNNWLYLFNYQSPNCSNIDGPTNQGISGGILRASWATSDFAVIELSAPIPTDYNIFLAGYNAMNTPASSVTSIHHPAGDIKKITFDTDGVFSASWGGGPANTHWEISEWEDGTTEGGSSGSPLFDQDKYFIGQLSGGQASCFSVNQYDAFGKLASDWEGGGTANSRIRDYLDPDNTGTLVLNGRYCSEADLELDASVSAFSGASGQSCETVYNPQFLFTNLGSETLTSMEFVFETNGGNSQIITWNGNIDFPSSEFIQIGELDLEPGNYTFTIEITLINGQETDENSSNDLVQSSLEVIDGVDMDFSISTDQWGDENSVILSTSTGEVIYSQDGYNDNQTTTESLCVATQCYTLMVTDSYGDGINNNTDTPADDGGFSVVVNGETLVEDGGVFGDCSPDASNNPCSAIYEFCLGDQSVLNPAFSSTGNTFCVGQTIQFQDQSTGAVQQWNWDFAGEGNSAQENPNFTFNSPGTYTVILIILNADGEPFSTTNEIIVSVAPSADFNASIEELSASFNSSESSLTGLTYDWDFGDGSGSSSNADPSYTYDEGGEFNVCLTVTNNGCSTQSCQSVVADCPAVSAEFVSVQSNLGIDLQAQSSEGSSWTWNFGDGSSDTGMDVTHTFATGGSFDICLTVESDCGSSSTVCETVNVASGLDESEDQLLNAFPNPTYGSVDVQTPMSGAAEWHLFDAKGALVKEGSVANANDFQIDLQDLQSGIYLLNLESQELRMQSKLIRF